MKSFSVKLGVILIIGFAIFCYAEVWGADWKYLGANELYIFYYDGENITRPAKDIVRVWTKVVYTEKGVIKAVETGGEKVKTLNHETTLYEINCREKKDRLLSRTFYSKEGDIIFSPKFSSEWRFAPPDSAFEVLYKAVCK